MKGAATLNADEAFSVISLMLNYVARSDDPFTNCPRRHAKHLRGVLGKLCEAVDFDLGVADYDCWYKDDLQVDFTEL